MSYRIAGARPLFGAFALAILFSVPAAVEESGRNTTLDEMQARKIVSRDEETWSEDDWQSYLRIRKAEREGAVDYLVRKYHRYGPFVLIVKDTEGLDRLVLSPVGFGRYYFHKSQNAVRAFEDRGVSLKEIFHLTDLRGHPFYDSEGLLTQEGEAAYDKLLAGQPAEWKFDWDPVPEGVLTAAEKEDRPLHCRSARFRAAGGNRGGGLASWRVVRFCFDGHF